jgi:hypothetical protein
VNLLQRYLVFFAPGRELRNRPEVRAARISVPDFGVKNSQKRFAEPSHRKKPYP